MFMNATLKWLKILRKNIKYYFIEIADKVKERSTCNSRKVGCVLVKDKQILATGYNGSIPGHEHCNELTCKRGCKETIHAEVNAVVSAARRGIALEGCDVYTTTSPCFECLKILLSINIDKIYYREKYKTNYQYKIDRLLKNHGKNIRLEQL